MQYGLIGCGNMGGSTIAGIRALENQGFRGAAMNCVLEAFRKNAELGK